MTDHVFQMHQHTLSDGGWLRYGIARPTAPLLSVLLLPGRSEFLEKYHHVVQHLLAQDVTVIGMDWRGQGGSFRELSNPEKGYVADFEDYLTDFRALWPTLRAEVTGPLVALGHSMGGHLLLRLLSQTPDLVAHAILSAPMSNLNFIGWQRVAIKALAHLLPETWYIPGGRNWRPYELDYPKSVLTSDLEALRWMTASAEQNPAVKLGHATVGWLRAAFESIEALQAPGCVERITTPVQFMACTRDAFISLEQQKAVVARLPVCELTLLEDSLHEPFFERVPIRQQALSVVDKVISRYRIPRPPSAN